MHEKEEHYANTVGSSGRIERTHSKHGEWIWWGSSVWLIYGSITKEYNKTEEGSYICRVWNPFRHKTDHVNQGSLVSFIHQEDADIYFRRRATQVFSNDSSILLIVLYDTFIKGHSSEQVHTHEEADTLIPHQVRHHARNICLVTWHWCIASLARFSFL